MKKQISDAAKSIGFYKTGVAPAREYNELLPILEKRGATPFVKSDLLKRVNPFLYFKEAQSIIVCILPYLEGDKVQNALYARGEDYHTVMKSKLHMLAKSIGLTKYRVLVDSGGLPDRYLAYLAGIGWYGMNNLLYTEGIGSRFYIGSILSALVLEPDKPMENKCKGCGECIKACPVGALGAGYYFNPYRCISYLTQKTDLTEEEEAIKAKGCYELGCDICQDVCPFNNQHSLKVI